MKNLVKFCVLASVTVWVNAAHAQSASGIPASGSEGLSHLVVMQDAALDDVLARRIEYNRRAATSPQGFRVLVYSGSQRQEAYNAQLRFRQAYPAMDAYLSYQFPNFKVMAGDFHSREEAAKVAGDLKSLFPDESLLVVPQKIDVSKLKQ